MNIIVKNEFLQDGDKDIFFLPDDEIIFVEPSISMADVGVMMGLFPSKGQARKSGWDGPIPDGWTEKLRCGKFRKNLWIWKPIKTIDI